MNEAEVAEMIQQMREGKSDAMDFVVTREKKVPGQTISAEALDELTVAVNAFIGARIMHHWDAKPGGLNAVGPSVIRAEVRITVDDVHVATIPNERPWFVIDGSTRYDA